jgi:putative transposase
VCVRLFTDFGLPQRLRPDHGVPCATHTRARLAPRSAWWVRLGILPAVIEPGQPPPNGRHERRHRTLKAETPRPPANTRPAPQDTCDHCRQELHVERPPDALDLHTPASREASSPRPWPATRPPREDHDRFAGRDVSAHGGLRWHRQWGNVSTCWAGEDVGLEERDEGVWKVSCGPLTRGRLLARQRRIEDASGRRTRHR